jgi:predicted unusual protein kinase regulating ubiquinone biosynthesis (AarF/ABC1/UbiB family)
VAEQSRLTASRLGRLGQLGRLAGGLAAGALGEGARRLAQGQRPAVDDLLLTPANARRLAASLAEMRGAAMKLGQLLSMDGGAVLPPAFSELLARLREDAHAMPLGQVAAVLKQSWGEGWDARFERFHFTPLAAASIGQVHAAVLRGGDRLAIKLQYPGVRDSIDSDIDNVAALLRLARLLPASMDVTPLLAEAKHQLHLEADYRQEAAALERYRALLAGDPRYQVPAVRAELSTDSVLAMDYLDGDPVETLANAPAALRDGVASALLDLALREVFDWGLVQTDPNFANYRFERGSGRLQLLDFGATRDYPAAHSAALRELLHACLAGDDADLAAAAVAVGYLAADDAPAYRAEVIGLLRTATEPARHPGAYDFGRCDLAGRMRDALLRIRVELGFTRLPPPGILFLHRKLGGLYLLLRHLRARVAVAERVAPWLEPAALAERAQA